MNEREVNVDVSFTAEHHALLFAWVAREAVALGGEQAAVPALRAAVRRYGEERGHRMALRAQQDGQGTGLHGVASADRVGVTSF